MKNEFMLLAIEEAKKDTNEVPVGAVLVKNKEVIASAHNECVAQNGICHAELLVIERALKKLGTTYLEDCELYVTKEPCLMCFGATVNARIKRVYFGCYDTKYGAMEYIEKLGYLHKINHVPETYGGIMEAECKTLLEEFFQ